MPFLTQYLLARLFPKKDPRKCRRELVLHFKTLREIAKLGKKKRSQPIKYANSDPILLGRRVVLRTEVRVPANLFSALHRLYKNDSQKANKLLSRASWGDPTRMRNTYLRCAIKAVWDERLKKDGQLAGIFPPDPDVDLATQELFEQFYDSHGKPNDAEKALLEQAGHVNVETIDKWFAAKEFRLQAPRAFYRIMRKLRYRDRSILLAKLKAWKPKKPLSRH